MCLHADVQAVSSASPQLLVRVDSPVARAAGGSASGSAPSLGSALSFLYAHVIGTASHWTSPSGASWGTTPVTSALQRPQAALIVQAPDVAVGGYHPLPLPLPPPSPPSFLSTPVHMHGHLAHGPCPPWSPRLS